MNRNAHRIGALSRLLEGEKHCSSQFTGHSFREATGGSATLG